MFSKPIVKKIFVFLFLPITIALSFLHIFLGSTEGALYSLIDSFYDTATLVTACIVLIGASLSILFAIISIILEAVKKNVGYLVLISTMFSLVAMVLSIPNTYITIPYTISSFIVSLLLSIYVVIFEAKNKNVENNEQPVDNKKGVVFSVIMGAVSLLALISIFFIPVCSYDGVAYFSLFKALGDSANLETLISFASFFVLYVLVLIYFTQSLIYLKNVNKLLKKTRTLIYLEFVLSIAFFAFSVVISYIEKNAQSVSVEKVSTLSYIPLLVIAVLAMVNSVVSSRFITFIEKVKDKKEHKAKLRSRILAFVFAVLFIGLLVGSLFSNILVIQYTSGGITDSVKINGFDVLKNYQDMETGYKALAFFIYLILVYAIVMLVITISLFFRKSRYFTRFAFITTSITFVMLIALSMFGKYYEITQSIQTETVLKILESAGISASISYEAKVSSQTVYFAIGGLALLVLMIIFKPYTRKFKEDEEAIDVNINKEGEGTSSVSALGEKKTNDFDPCPAFSDIDSKEEVFNAENKERGEHVFDKPSLDKVCSFIVDYAKNSRLHLSYQKEDIAQFIAGLGSSRLSILQGMSGTGKTSLPKIFSEAIFGRCDIIEVESSWKDKNELIGFYNEFSSKFTPKKFTQALYKAKFNPDVITLIVLDEMNLSRIEYYFSDFLSLMENEEDKREINLLNTQLHPIVSGEIKDYKKLEEGHILKIPSNVWFIGTANRDESTFEISDKVYDRAMTMNFNKRAKKIKDYKDPIDKKYLSYSSLKGLIDNAKETYKFDCESNPIVKKVEKIVAPFNISFGNRILNQIESFVSIYCSCFKNPQSKEDEALEKILLTKVVQKLEFKSIENKEELVRAFESVNLLRCAEFISKLNEDF